MKKKLFRYIFPVICVLVVIITFVMIFDIKKKVNDIDYNTNDIALSSNTVENEIENEIENEVENKVDNEVEENANNVVSNNAVTNMTRREDVEESNDEGSTVKKQQAIDIVKQKWGEDSNVSFRCETVNEKGEYVVAAILKSSGSVKTYFNVNLETKQIEIDY